jgi:hypothetical protein
LKRLLTDRHTLFYKEGDFVKRVKKVKRKKKSDSGGRKASDRDAEFYKEGDFIKTVKGGG